MTKKQLKDFEKLVSEVFAVDESAGEILVSMAENDYILQPSRYLLYCFVWCDTIQGHDYWANIYEELGARK